MHEVVYDHILQFKNAVLKLAVWEKSIKICPENRLKLRLSHSIHLKRDSFLRKPHEGRWKFLLILARGHHKWFEDILIELTQEGRTRAVTMFEIGSEHIWNFLWGEMEIINEDKVLLWISVYNFTSGEVVEVIDAASGVAIEEECIIAEFKAGNLAEKRSAATLTAAKKYWVSLLKKFDGHR